MANPVGRPKLELDLELLEKLATFHCTMKEMASAVGCSVDTLERNYADIITKGRESGKISLRKLQLEAAKKGNIVMLIWLGKQMLGQSDKTQIELSKVTDDALAAEAARRLADGPSQS